MTDRVEFGTGGHPLGLLTDLYELRMAETCLTEGMTGEATFTLYVRPAAQRPWLLAAGTQRVLELLDRFTYGPEEIDYLSEHGFDDGFLDWLADLEISGEMWAVADGTVLLGDEPLLELTAPLPVAMLLESSIMNVAHFPTLVATKAARCHLAADGRSLADFGLRRAHGLEAGIEAARAAYIGGVGTTSNVEAGRRFDIPIVGTMAHAFIQAFDDEVEAFRAFARNNPGNSVLLVDTYDTLDGVRNAVRVGEELRPRGEELTGIRLDSGDLVELATDARRILDDAGFENAQIFASGNMDEYTIRDLVAAAAPIDAFGVGTSLTTSRDHPAMDIVYKLVDFEGSPRAKYSTGKVLLPGAKQVFRHNSPADDVLARRGEDLPGDALLAPVWRDGQRLVTPDLESARERAAAQLKGLPQEWHDPDPVEPAPGPAVSDELQRLADELRGRDLA